MAERLSVRAIVVQLEALAELAKVRDAAVHQRLDQLEQRLTALLLELDAGLAEVARQVEEL